MPAEFLEDMADIYPQEPQPQPSCMVLDLFKTWRLDSGSYEEIAEVSRGCLASTLLTAECAVVHDRYVDTLFEIVRSSKEDMSSKAACCHVAQHCQHGDWNESQCKRPGGRERMGAAVCGCAAGHASPTAPGAHALQPALGRGSAASLQVLDRQLCLPIVRQSCLAP